MKAYHTLLSSGISSKAVLLALAARDEGSSVSDRAASIHLYHNLHGGKSGNKCTHGRKSDNKCAHGRKSDNKCTHDLGVSHLVNHASISLIERLSR